MIVANGTATALTSLNCTLNQIIKFDVSGFSYCGTDEVGTGAFVNGGNSFGATATIGTNDNFGFNIETNNTARMNFTNNGFMGIYTAAPRYALDLRKNGTTGGALFATGGVISDNNPYTSVEHSNGLNYSAPLNVITSGADTTGGIHIGVGQGYSETPGDPNYYAIITERNNNNGYWDNGARGAVASGDYLPGLAFAGQSNNQQDGMVIGAAILGRVDGAVSNATVPTSLVFRTSATSSAGLAERLRITSAGNVGIGNIAPTTVLDINGATTQRGMAAPALSTAGQGRIYFDSTSNKFRVSQNGAAYADLVSAGGSGDIANGGNSFGAAATIGTNDNFALNFETNSSTKMTVLSTGEVGIGTPSPTFGLDILGSFRIMTRADEGNRIVVNGGTQPSGSTLIKGGTDNNGHGGGSINLGGGSNNAYSSDIVVTGGTSGYNSDPTGTGRIFLQGGNDSNSANYAPLVLQNVGIGTASPAAKLDVRGPYMYLLNPTPGGEARYRLYNSNSAAEWFLGQKAGEEDFTISRNSGGETVFLRVAQGGALTANTISSNGTLRTYSAGAGDVSISHAGLVSSMTAAATVQLALGAGGSEAMRISTAGNVGVGTTAPATALDVRGANGLQVARDGAADFRIRSAGGAGTGNPRIGIYSSRGTIASPTAPLDGDLMGSMTFYNTDGNYSAKIDVTAVGDHGTGPGRSGGKMEFRTTLGGTNNQAIRMTLADNGNVGIGPSAPAARLDVADTGTTTSAIIVPRAAAFTGTTVNGMVRYNSTSNLFEFYQNGSWVNYTTVSDSRLKTNITAVTKGLDVVNQLNPVFYDWDQNNPRTKSFGDKHQVGFIAQEVEKVLPEVVNVGEDSYRSVEYGKMVAVVVAAVKELYTKFLGHEEQLATQARQIATIQSENEKLKQENAAIKSYLCSKDPKPDFCK